MRAVPARFIRAFLCLALATPAFVLNVPVPVVQAKTPDPQVTHLAPEDWAALASPYRADVESDGEFWVTEATNCTVRKFDKDGNELLKLGEDGVKDTAVAPASLSTTRFGEPRGVAVDSETGEVYVADYVAKSIRVLSSDDGRQLRSFPTYTALGTVGSYLDGIALGPGHTVYALVIISALDRVLVSYSATGEILRSSSKFNPGAQVIDLAVEASGTVHAVARSGAVRTFQPVESEPTSFSPFVATTVPGATWLTGIDLDHQGNLVVVDQGYLANTGKMMRLDPRSPATVLDSWGTWPTGSLLDPAVHYTGTTDELLLVDKTSKAIERWSSVVAADSPVRLDRYSGSSSALGAFNSPKKSVLTTDHLFVIDSGNSRIERFDHEATQAVAFSAPGATAISAVATGGLLVAYGATIQRLDMNGTVEGDFPTGGATSNITDIEVDPEGRVYVTDAGVHAAMVFAPEGGAPLSTWTMGSEGASLLQPGGLAIATDGSVWVADTGNHRIQHIGSDGTPVDFAGVLGVASSGNGYLSSPKDVEIGLDGTVWVADTGNSRLAHYCPTAPYSSFHDDGQVWWYTQYISKPGVGTNKFNALEGLAISPLGRLYVSDTGAHHLMSGDVQAPVTSVTGVPSEWTSHTVNAGFSAFELSPPVTTYAYLSPGGDSLVPSGTTYPISQDGTHTLSYYSIDSKGTKEIAKQVMVRVDRTAPEMLEIRGVPATWSSTSSVVATVQALDTVSGITNITYRLNDGPETPYVDTITVDGEGVTTITVTATDRAGNQSVTSTPVRLDRIAPVSTTTVGPLQVEPRSVTVGAIDAGVGTAAVYYRLDSQETTVLGTAFDLYCESGTSQNRTVWTWSVDALGNTSEPTSTIVPVDLDVVGPSGTAVIADDREWVSAASVTATAAVFDAYEMSVAATDTGTWGPWGAYQPTTTWTLPAEATYTVGVRYRDRASAYHDTTTTALTFTHTVGYDRTAPDAPSIGGVPSGWTSGSVDVTATASDALSMVEKVEYHLGDGVWTDYAAGPITVSGNGVRTVTVRATDFAGNTSAESTAAVRLDNVKPVTATTPDLSTRTTWSNPTKLTFSVIDTGSAGVTVFHRLDGGEATTTAMVTVAGETSHTIEWWGVDAAGNVETTNVREFKILQPATRSTMAVSASAVTYGTRLTLTGTLLESTTSKPVTGAVVKMESSPNGVTWTQIYTPTPLRTDAYGRVQLGHVPSAKAYYRLSFEGDVWHKKASTTSAPAALVYPTLTRPVTPTRVYKGRYFSAYAYLRPSHVGQSTRLQFFHYESGRWILRKTVYARNYAYNATTSKVYARTSLSLRGSWRVRAYHPYDTSHQARYSVNSRTITVR